MSAAGEPPPLRTRPGAAADREGIARISGHWGDVVARAGGTVALDDCETIVAERADGADGLLVGALRLRVADGRGEVVTIDAAPPGAGTGRALLDAAVDLATAAGCTALWLVTTNDNVRAQRFYRRYGFELVGVDRGAVDRLRASVKPEIPATGEQGIPIRDELTYELALTR